MGHLDHQYPDVPSCLGTDPHSLPSVWQTIQNLVPYLLTSGCQCSVSTRKSHLLPAPALPFRLGSALSSPLWVSEFSSSLHTSVPCCRTRIPGDCRRPCATTVRRDSSTCLITSHSGSLLCASVSSVRRSSSPPGKGGFQSFSGLEDNCLSPPPAQQGANRDLRDADTRGSPPGSRDRRTAAWSQRSPDRSGRRTTCEAAGTVPCSPRCSRLHNLQGPRSGPAIRYSPSPHLNRRQAVQGTTWPHTHAREVAARRTAEQGRELGVSDSCYCLVLELQTEVAGRRAYQRLASPHARGRFSMSHRPFEY